MEKMGALAALIMFLLFCVGEFSAVPQLRRAGGLCAHLIESAGFPCTEHQTKTKDGYLLGLQRVSSSSTIVRGEMGLPVLLIHGLFMAGDAWFLNSASQSLGFILADKGFDVWVGNVRGTRWSHGHVSLSVKNKGTIMSLAAFTKPDIVEMVRAAALLCPISYLNHITTDFVLRLVKMRLDEVILALGIHQLNFKSNMGTQIMDMMCDGHIHCDIWLSAITGKNCCFNDSRIDFYLEYEPHPSSSKNLHHLFQMIRKGGFAMYDYGMWKNLMRYNQPKPPVFDISQIPTSLPLWMGYGGNDALADVIDVQHTLKGLKSKPDLLYIEEYGHIDFLLSTRAKADVYDDMIRFFNSVQKGQVFSFLHPVARVRDRGSYLVGEFPCFENVT